MDQERERIDQTEEELKFTSGAGELEQIANLVGDEIALTTKCCASGTCN